MVSKIVVVVVLLYGFIISVVPQPAYLPNVDCGSYVDYVATDPGYYRYTPYYVKLHRCHGRNIAANPRNKKCVPTKIDNVVIYGVISDTEWKPVTVQNHTSCKEICVLNASMCTPYQTYHSQDCACLCNYTATPTPDPCQTPFYWDTNICNCRCSHKSLTCEKKKEFNSEICGCRCKEKFRMRCAKRQQYLDETTCGCIDPKVITGASKSGCKGEINGGILAVIMIMEALAFVVAYFFFYSYCYKRKYLPQKEAKNNASYYHNGDVANGTYPRPRNEFNTISLDEDETNSVTTDKELIKQEEHNRHKEKSIETPMYYADEEKSRLTPKHDDDDEWYMYNDIMEVDGPTREGSRRSNLVPPSYADYVSDHVSDHVSELSEDGYASVTQV